MDHAVCICFWEGMGGCRGGAGVGGVILAALEEVGLNSRSEKYTGKGEWEGQNSAWSSRSGRNEETRRGETTEA